MKTPAWLAEQIAIHGAQIAADEISKDDAIRAITALARLDHPEHIVQIYSEHIDRELRAWMTRRAHDTILREHDHLELFPGAPAIFETRPGHFAAVAVMTRKDWTAALKQADTKASNATGHRDIVQRCHDLIVPLLTSDDLTTADVWPPNAQLQLAATP